MAWCDFHSLRLPDHDPAILLLGGSWVSVHHPLMSPFCYYLLTTQWLLLTEYSSWWWFASASKVQSSSRGIFMLYKQPILYLGLSVSFSSRTSSSVQFHPRTAIAWSLSISQNHSRIIIQTHCLEPADLVILVTPLIPHIRTSHSLIPLPPASLTFI